MICVRDCVMLFSANAICFMYFCLLLFYSACSVMFIFIEDAFFREMVYPHFCYVNVNMATSRVLCIVLNNELSLFRD